MYADKYLIDEKLKELDEIDPDLVRDLFILYFEMIAGKQCQLQEAFSENRWDVISSIAHSLKSTYGNLGSKILFDKLVQLEKQLKNMLDQNSKEQVEVLLLDVLAEMDLFSNFISERNKQFQSFEKSKTSIAKNDSKCWI